MTTQLDRAVYWWGMGVSVIPLKPRGKTPLLKTWTPYRDRRPALDELRSWFLGQDYKNLGVIAARGLVVLDFDNIEYFRVFCSIAAPPATYQVETARGVHLYYWLDEPVSQQNLGWVEVKSGGYVVGAGSVHPTGHIYRDNGLSISRVKSLADVISPDLLPHTEQGQPDARPAAPPPDPPPDPWKVASCPSQFGQPDLVATIKKRVSILSFFPDARRTGANFWIARCPFHDDREPSLWLNTQLGICGCYAGCTQKPLDVINLHARLNCLDNFAALDDLRRRYLL